MKKYSKEKMMDIFQEIENLISEYDEMFSGTVDPKKNTIRYDEEKYMKIVHELRKKKKELLLNNYPDSKMRKEYLLKIKCILKCDCKQFD